MGGQVEQGISNDQEYGQEIMNAEQGMSNFQVRKQQNPSVRHS